METGQDESLVLAGFVSGPLGLGIRKPTDAERASIMRDVGPALLAWKMSRAL